MASHRSTSRTPIPRRRSPGATATLNTGVVIVRNGGADGSTAGRDVLDELPHGRELLEERRSQPLREGEARRAAMSGLGGHARHAGH